VFVLRTLPPECMLPPTRRSSCEQTSRMSLSTAPRLTVAELRAIGLFAALPDEVHEYLAATLELRSLAAGEIVFREGDAARDMFAVVSGEMEVLKRSRRGREARVALLGPGDWFGEMSIVDVQPRSASVRVLSPSRVVRMTAADLDALYRRDIRAYAIIILNLARELSRRLRVADGILADLIANVLDSYLAQR
jgi:CRP/FNR family cyclic AMP-dependent transcriptional regulator